MTPTDSIIITFIALLAVTCIKLYFNSKMDKAEYRKDYVHYYGKKNESAQQNESDQQDESVQQDESAQQDESEEFEHPVKYIIAEGKRKVHKVSCISVNRIRSKVSVTEDNMHLYDKCKMCFR